MKPIAKFATPAASPVPGGADGPPPAERGRARLMANGADLSRSAPGAGRPLPEAPSQRADIAVS